MAAADQKDAQLQSSNFMGDLSKRINDNTQRIRLLEGDLEGVESRLNTLEQNFLEFMQNTDKNVNHITADVSELRDKIVNLSIDVQKLNRATTKLVSKKDVKEMEEYVNLLSPMMSKFVTRKEVEVIIKEELESRL